MPEYDFASKAIPEITSSGLFFCSDPHTAAQPPGQRIEGYTEQVLDKLHACLEKAQELNLTPVILGDLFHWPRDNANSLLVSLIELFRPFKPWVLVGNHDKYQARYTSDVSLAVLVAADVIHLMNEPGPQFKLNVGTTEVIVGASPDGERLPTSFTKNDEEIVIWCTHHNIGFPDYEEKPVKIREIPGIDWIMNGHIHRPQPTQVRGSTRWVNNGGLVRMAFVLGNKNRKPLTTIWRPDPAGDEPGIVETWTPPFLPFEEVFPDRELPTEEEESKEERESRFLKGLETLAWRKTQEGVGLKRFLESNLPQGTAETEIIWKLYEEIANARELG